MRFTVSNQQWNIYYKINIGAVVVHGRAVVDLKWLTFLGFHPSTFLIHIILAKIQSWCEAKEMSHILYMPSYFCLRIMSCLLLFLARSSQKTWKGKETFWPFKAFTDFWPVEIEDDRQYWDFKFSFERFLKNSINLTA